VVMLPEVDSGVWIEFEAGDISYPIWSGCYWREGEVPEDAAEDAKAIFTKAGSLVLSDADSSLTLEDADGHKVVVDGDGVLIAGDSGKIAVGSKVSINDGALDVS